MIINPIQVFQCATCNSILGDSTSSIIEEDELKIMTLRSVCNVTKDTKPCTSTHERDYGSTFQELICIGCQSSIGKFYVTTPRHLDNIRDYYSLCRSSINIYEIGPTNIITTTTAAAGIINNPTEQHETVIGNNNEDIIKLKNMMVIMDGRVQELEDKVEQLCDYN